jgi:glycosyltransferase involved in cell wall biosynthesis
MSNVERSRVLIITDAYFPSNSSVAILIDDLAKGLGNQGVEVTLVIPNANQSERVRIFSHHGCEIISIKALKTKDIGYIQRTIHEFFNPFLMWGALKKAPHFLERNYQGVIWYSPTIFWGPLVKRLKDQFHCPSYLVLRDIFPDWAQHLGLLGPGMKYWFFDAVARFQYRQADRIGVQSPNNLQYFQKHYSQFSTHAEILWNWVSPNKKKKNTTKNTAKPTPCSIVINDTSLKGRTVIVYAGNVGVAQGGYAHLLALAKLLHVRTDLGIFVVGRGSEITQLRHQIAIEQLSNMLVHDEIAANEMPTLLEQCHMGLVLLDQRHQTNNITGKFLTYLQARLPILAWVNPENDLMDLISMRSLGFAYAGGEAAQFAHYVLKFVYRLNDQPINTKQFDACLKELFSTDHAAQQIMKSLHSMRSES